MTRQSDYVVINSVFRNARFWLKGMPHNGSRRRPSLLSVTVFWIELH